MHLFVTPNAAASAMVYEIPPKDLLEVDRAAQELGADIARRVPLPHPHRRLPVADRRGPGHRPRLALRPGLAALTPTPVVRSYRIAEGQIAEEQVVVPGLGVPGLDLDVGPAASPSL